VSVGMVPAIRCHQQNMKTTIINGSEVSRLSVAIQSNVFVTAEYLCKEVMPNVAPPNKAPIIVKIASFISSLATKLSDG
ncbi:hypothetical protein, partial [Cedecea sp. VD20]